MPLDAGLNLEQPLLIQGGDGTTLWIGLGFPGAVHQGAVNAEASATINPGQVLAWDDTSLRCMTWDAAATATIVKAVRKVKLMTTTVVPFAGIALNKAAVGEKVLVAAAGSLLPVRSLASASLTANNKGSLIVPSTTAGAADAKVGTTLQNHAFGRVILIAGTTGQPTDSGSDTHLIGTINAAE